MSTSLERLLRPLGVPGILGLGVGVAVLVMYLSWYRPLHTEMLRLDTARPAGIVAPLTATAERSSAAALEALLHQLPAESAIGDQVNVLHAIAAKHGVQLRRGGYDLVWETAGRLGRQRMVLHSDASYPAMRHFLREALIAQPALSLDDIAFTRRQSSMTSLETTLTFTLLVSRTPDVKLP